MIICRRMVVFVAACVFVLAAPMVGADGGASDAITLPLSGTWKIMLGDDAAYRGASYDDSSWDQIELPGTFMSYVVKRQKSLSGVVWLRKSFDLSPVYGKQDLGLILGRIANADETYFNGEKIGSTGGFPPDEHSMWNHPRHYLIPPPWPQRHQCAGGARLIQYLRRSPGRPGRNRYQVLEFQQGLELFLSHRFQLHHHCHGRAPFRHLPAVLCAAA